MSFNETRPFSFSQVQNYHPIFSLMSNSQQISIVQENYASLEEKFQDNNGRSNQNVNFIFEKYQNQSIESNNSISEPKNRLLQPKFTSTNSTFKSENSLHISQDSLLPFTISHSSQQNMTNQSPVYNNQMRQHKKKQKLLSYKKNILQWMKKELPRMKLKKYEKKIKKNQKDEKLQKEEKNQDVHNQIVIKKCAKVVYFNPDLIKQIDDPTIDQVYVYGVAVINFKFLSNQDTAYLSAGRRVDYFFFLKKENFLIIKYGEKPYCHKKFNGIIERLLKVPNQRYHDMALGLAEYEQIINDHQKIGQQYKNLLKDNSQIDLYEQHYQRFEKWAINHATKKFKQSKIISFAILKFDLNSLEVEVKINGYNSNLLRVRGLNQYNYSRFFRQEVFHLYDGETVFNQTMNIINQKLNKPTQVITNPKILRFDNDIPVKTKYIDKQQISNRDLYFCDLKPLPLSTLPFEFLLVMQEIVIDDNVLLDIPSFQEPNEVDSEDHNFLDLYRIKSEEFEKKYYEDKMCNMACCQYNEQNKRKFC